MDDNEDRDADASRRLLADIERRLRDQGKKYGPTAISRASKIARPTLDN